jgi:hypothetical protein
MAILTTLDTFTAVGSNQIGSPTTTPDTLKNIALIYEWVNTAGNGTVTLGFDAFLSDGTWVSGLFTSPGFDASTSKNGITALVLESQGLLIQGIRPNITIVGATLSGTLKVQLRMED